MKAYTRLINEKHGNLRDVLGAIEMGEMAEAVPVPAPSQA